MSRRRRRFLAYLAAFVLVLGFYTLAYLVGMAVFEGESRTFTESLLVVVETFTTTGYGEDAGTWDSPQLIVLMVAMQFTGVLFIFMALPLFVVPWIEQRLSTKPPESVADASDHVVICSYSERIGTLMDELDAAGVRYVVVEKDRDAATELVEDGHQVVNGDPETAATLENARLRQARSLVVDVGDEINASVALTAAEICEDCDVDIVTFCEDPDLTEYHRYAGADTVLTPRTLIAESLASKVTAAASAEVADVIELDEDYEIAEMPVQPGSRLAGMSIRESAIRERTGAMVLGAWFRGEFRSPPPPDRDIDARTILLVAGHEDDLERLKELTLADRRQRRHGDVVVCGYGIVGSTIARRVRSAGIGCTIVDSDPTRDPDVEGDVTDVQTLERAGVADASTVILALATDTDAVFTTMVARQLDDDVEIVARANATESVRKLYRAGADYALALGTVSGRMLASTVLEEDVISYDQQVEIVRWSAGRLAGQTIAGADIRARTGCTVLAIERNGQVITDFDPSIRIEDDDDLVVAGPDENVSEFTALVN